MTLSRRHIRIALFALVFALVLIVLPHAAGAATAPTSDAADRIQNPSGCWYDFSFTRCVVNPLALWSSSAMLSAGGYVLRLSGSLFDFSVNQLIINFKSTLDTLHLVNIINSGWTFFRDLGNILIISIFVFIAISLILGLKEYGQKRLIARVLLIAVLMNFSLLFTKIVIDVSNFVAYAIYSQTAGGAAGGAPLFSIADSVLAPLKVTGVWDTTALAAQVFQQPDGGGPVLSIMFGFFGMFLLLALAAVIFYGAFLILARALLFIFLMLTAPIAYSTYMAPHFESGYFGWNNWWRALINNAAFAPLLMMFLSISLLIFGTASKAVDARDTLGAVLTDPPKILANGWQVLVVYVIGTGLLFISFRMSSSIAGSISGIRLGQMAPVVPFAVTGAGAAWLAQRTAGRYYAGQADKKGTELQQARLNALSGKGDWATVERLRKEKAALDKKASSGFNLFNTRAGKALTAGVGLGAGGVLAGQTKGNFKDDLHAKAVAAEDLAKQAKVTNDDKKGLRDLAKKETEANHDKELKDAQAKLSDAKAALDKAREENANFTDPEKKKQLEQQTEEEVVKNTIERAPEVQAAKVEIDKVTVDAGSQKATITASFDKQVADLRKATQDASSSERDEAARKIAKLEADRKSAIDAQDNRIKTARQKLTTITTEIEAPRAALAERQKKAAAALKEREAEHTQLTKRVETLSAKTPEQIEKDSKKLGDQKIKTAEANSQVRGSEIAADVSRKFGPFGGGAAGTHIVQHHFDETVFKKKSSAESIREAISNMNKEEKKEGGTDQT